MLDEPMKPATKTEVQRPTKARTESDLRIIRRGDQIIYFREVTPEQRHAGVAKLLKGMPRTIRPGEKPAHVLLAEYRAGK